MLNSYGPYKYLLPSLLSVIGTTLWNLKIPKELGCRHMVPYKSFNFPKCGLH
jgi:hypothetical protein